MRVVIQRVAQASVIICGLEKSAIGRGLLVLLAIEETDNAEDIEWLSGKIVRLRIFADEASAMNRSVQKWAAKFCWSASSHCLPARGRETGLPLFGPRNQKSPFHFTKTLSYRWNRI